MVVCHYETFKFTIKKCMYTHIYIYTYILKCKEYARNLNIPMSSRLKKDVPNLKNIDYEMYKYKLRKY